MTGGAARALLAAVWLGLACAGPGRSSRPADIPARQATGGDPLLRLVPGGAQLVAELDLARLRANPAVAPLVQLLLSPDIARGLLPDRFVLLRDADVIAVASYELGGAAAGTLTVVRGDNVAALPRARRFDERTAVLGPAPLAARMLAGARSAAGPSRELLALRARAMPEPASGGVLRLAARLDFDARVGLARTLRWEEVPASISLWGDVADDLALVALLESDTPRDAQRLLRACRAGLRRLARESGPSGWLFGHLQRGLRLERRDRTVRVVLVIGPRRLHTMVSQVERYLRSEFGADGRPGAGSGGLQMRRWSARGAARDTPSQASTEP